jgi:hypothetical protein
VIQPRNQSFKALLEEVTVLSEVVGQSSQAGFLAPWPECGEAACHGCHRVEVVTQQVLAAMFILAVSEMVPHFTLGAVRDRCFLHLWCLPEVDFSPVETR